MNSDQSSDSPQHQASSAPEPKPETKSEKQQNGVKGPTETKVGASVFFDTLEWQQEEAAVANGDTPGQEKPTEDMQGLLGADDEDDFASLTTERAHTPGDNGENKKVDSAFFADFDAQTNEPVDLLNSDFEASSEPAVDLLNMNATSSTASQKVTNEMDLLNIGDTSTNFDLLGNDVTVPEINTTDNDFVFDPFKDIGSQPAPELSSQPQPFDPFGSANQQAKSSSGDAFLQFLESQPAQKTDESLMGSWDSENILESSALKTTIPNVGGLNVGGLNGGLGNIHKSSSASSLSSSSQPAVPGFHSPTLQPKRTHNDSGIGPVPKADPFGDLGECISRLKKFFY